MTEINELVFSIANILSLSVKGPIAYFLVPAVALILVAFAVRIMRRPERTRPSIDANKKNTVQKTGSRRSARRPGTIADINSPPLLSDHPRTSDQLHSDEVRTE